MILTNRFNLPQPIAKAVANDPYTKGDADISATSLIGPARKRVLEHRHADEITEDVSERLFALIGQVTHGILERADEEALTEKRLFIKRHGWTISGAFDRLIIADGLVQDYKVTSTYALKDGPKPEWVAQQNIYALMLFAHGYAVSNLEVVVIFRDWQKSKARHSPDYPQLPAMVYKIPRWQTDVTEDYIKQRILTHQDAEKTLPRCTPEERWERPAIYKVQREGNTRARSRHETWDEANAAIEADAHKDREKRPLHIIEEPAYAKRCHDGWCPAALFCDQAKALAKQQIGGEIAQALRR